MAPSSTPATRTAPGAATVRTGTRARVVLARTSAGMGPVRRHTLNSEFLYPNYQTHIHTLYF